MTTQAKPPVTLTQLEQAIWRTVAYVDVFDYPLTIAEIHRYLEGIAATPADVEAVLDHGDLLPNHLARSGDFFHLRDRDITVATRRVRAARARQLWPPARRYGRFIARLPFVRMVAVTGSLAMNNVADDADIDYFIVTEDGRLWLARACTIGVVRLAARRGVMLCPNYFLAESALVLPERNLYTARELAQMAPLSGHRVYQQLRLVNDWTSRFLPNADGPPHQESKRERPDRWPQLLAELPLRTPIGRWLEQWEQKRKIAKLSRKQRSVNENGYTAETGFSATICKGHFRPHQQRTLAAYYQRLEHAQE